MGFKVNVRGIDVEVTSLEELDALIRRYGVDRPSAKPPTPSRNSSSTNRSSDGSAASTDADYALLHRFLKARHGVPSAELSSVLGAKKRGLPGALERWATRVGLIRKGQRLPMGRGRVDGNRVWTLTREGLELAKQVPSPSRPASP
jgi:hypothetical protein